MSEKSCLMCTNYNNSYCILCYWRPKEDIISEKRCDDCKVKGDYGFCKHNIPGACWQPKEDKVRKPIFESGSEAHEFIREWQENYKLHTFTEFCKQAGYIRCDPVEEAEEILNTVDVNEYTVENIRTVAKGFWELKKQLDTKKES